MIECKICKKIFKNYNSLSIHITKFHKDVIKIQNIINKGILILDDKIKYTGKIVKNLFKDLLEYRQTFIKGNINIDTNKYPHLQHNIEWVFRQLVEKFKPKYVNYKIGEITPFGIVNDVYKNQYQIDNIWINKCIFDDFFNKFK